MGKKKPLSGSLAVALAVWKTAVYILNALHQQFLPLLVLFKEFIDEDLPEWRQDSLSFLYPGSLFFDLHNSSNVGGQKE